MPARPTPRRKLSDRVQSQASTPRTRSQANHDEAPPNSPVSQGDTSTPYQLTIETEPSTPARVTRSMSGLSSSQRSLMSMPLITPVSHANFPPQSHSSPFWLQLSPLDASASQQNLIREHMASTTSRSYSHTTLTTPAAGLRGLRQLSTPLDLMSPQSNEATPFTAITDSTHSASTLSTPRPHRSPQKFTFQSRSRPHLRTPESSESQSGSTASQHSTKRPSYVQRLDFSAAVDEDADSATDSKALKKPQTSNGSASESDPDSPVSKKGKTSRSQTPDVRQPTASPFPFGQDLISPAFHMPTSSPLATSTSLSLSTSSARPSSPSIFSPNGNMMPYPSVFPPSPSPRPPGMLGSSHWLSPSPMNSTNTGGGPVYLSLPNASAGSYTLPSPSHPSLASPLSNFTPSSFSSSVSSTSTANHHDSPRIVSNASSPSVSSTNSFSPDRPEHPINSTDPNSASSANVVRMTPPHSMHHAGMAAHPHQLSNLFPQQFLNQQISQSASSSSGSKHCNCKKSKCLKLYCECFARGDVCRGCNCIGCENTAKEEDQPKREKAAQQVMERDKNGFYRKSQTEQNAAPRTPNPLVTPNVVMKFMLYNAIANQHQQNPQAPLTAAHAAALVQQIANSQRPPAPPSAPASVHPKGCGCKKSECQKKYCECFQAGVKCSEACKCVSCRNGKHDDHHHHSAEPDTSIGMMMTTVPEDELLSAPSSASRRQRPVKPRIQARGSPGTSSPNKRSAAMYESQSTEEHNKKVKSEDSVPVT